MVLEALSMKITDSPGAMLVMPFSATDDPKEFELSSIFQPLMTWAAVPILVTSNQSAATGLLPLDHGATSEMMIEGVPPVDAVMVSVKSTDASGLAPTAGSSTFTVTL